MLRIGQGFDAHRFEVGRPLILGGVTVPYEYGMEAHSDGDVLIHALVDALLGAAALGDIGQHFPDTDKLYKNIDSRILLRKAVELLQQKNYQINNIDITVVAQQPKLAPHIPAMRTLLATDLKVSLDQLSIKATTTEHMGFTGRKEGIAVFAVVLLDAL